MKNPGINNKSFFIRLDKTSFYKKNEILILPNSREVKIIKTYPYNWYRKILNFLHLPFKTCDIIKCKTK